jgi:hypothetical protein
MSDEPKKRSRKRWPSWRTVVLIIALPALYVIAYGPLSFLIGAEIIGDDGTRVFLECYEPLRKTLQVFPTPVNDALVRYSNACFALGHRLARG